MVISMEDHQLWTKEENFDKSRLDIKQIQCAYKTCNGFTLPRMHTKVVCMRD